MSRHSDLAANRSHEPAFHQATDPASDADNRVTNGKQWMDTSTTPPTLKVRISGAWVLSTTGALATTTNPVVVSGASSPSSGQVLTATSSTAANWQTPSGGGGATVYKQTTYQATTIGSNNTGVTSYFLSTGTSTIPAGTTQTITVNKGSGAASHIFTVYLTVSGGFANSVYLTSSQTFPITGSTFTINNNDDVSHDVLIMAVVD